MIEHLSYETIVIRALNGRGVLHLRHLRIHIGQDALTYHPRRATRYNLGFPLQPPNPCVLSILSTMTTLAPMIAQW